MKSKILQVIVVLIAAVCVGVAADSSLAADTHFTATSGNWNNGANWDNGIPDDTSHAIIDSGKTCTFDLASTTIDRLTVQSTGVLNISTGNVLEIDGGNPTSTINGTVNLEGSGSEISLVSVDITFSDGGGSAGSIVGKADDALIDLSSQTLTNEVIIEGRMTITAGEFVNEGIVRANRNGTMLFDVSDIADVSGAVWETSTTIVGGGSGGPVLQFTIDAAGSSEHDIEGDFQIPTGVLNINGEPICTTGELTWAGGDVDCDSGYIRFMESCS